MQLNIIVEDNLMQQARLLAGVKSEQEIVKAALTKLDTEQTAT